MRRGRVLAGLVLATAVTAACSTSADDTAALEARVQTLESQLAMTSSSLASTALVTTSSPTTTTVVVTTTSTTAPPTTTTTAPPTTTTADLGPIIYGAPLESWMAWGGLPTVMEWIGDWQAFRTNFAGIGSPMGARANCSWFAEDNLFPYPAGSGIPPYLRDAVAGAPATETRDWISSGLDHAELAIQHCMAGDFASMSPAAVEADRLLGGGQSDLREIVTLWRQRGGPTE